MATTSVRILELFILPPNCIARLGGSQTPLESYTWGDDPTIAGRATTVIEPTVSFEVVTDGSIRPYMPNNIRFKDGNLVRPVAPFLELWAKVLDDGAESESPVTLDLLNRAGASAASLSFRVTAANRKAERRSGDESCGFTAEVNSVGTDYAEKQLMATSPNRPGSQPLVFADRPIPLGKFQVIRPLRAIDLGVDLSIIRMRFTPAAGDVYGPPTASSAMAPATNRIHEIVKPQNRNLNPAALWTQYDSSYTRFRNPEPSDTYDGASINDGVSWGVVDDTCDVLVECDLVADGILLQAAARIAVAPPHFAPDRRPFVSLADDLKDRDEPIPQDAAPVTPGDTQEELEIRINDLFQRALEVASLFNVDANRARAIRTNGGAEQVPDTARTDQLMMTRDDLPFADLSATDWRSVPHARLPLSDLVSTAHGPLADLDSMVTKLREEAERVRKIIRPPYGFVRELSPTPATIPNLKFRDPRIVRDTLYDMRMPPFMRDSDASAMSITHRQYDELMSLLTLLEEKSKAATGKKPATERQPTAATVEDVSKPIQADSPIRRRVAEFVRSQARTQQQPE